MVSGQVDRLVIQEDVPATLIIDGVFHSIGTADIVFENGEYFASVDVDSPEGRSVMGHLTTTHLGLSVGPISMKKEANNG